MPAPEHVTLNLADIGHLDDMNGDIFAGVELPLISETHDAHEPTKVELPSVAPSYEVPGLDDEDGGAGDGTQAALSEAAQVLKALSPESLMALAVGDKEQVAAIEEQLKTAHRLSNKVSAFVAAAELRRRAAEGKVPTDVLLNMYKTFAAEGALTPKDDKGAGGGFSLTIVGLGQPVQVQAAQVVENEG